MFFLTRQFLLLVTVVLSMVVLGMAVYLNKGWNEIAAISAGVGIVNAIVFGGKKNEDIRD